MRIIAQSHFDVNQENIEGAVLVGLSTGNRIVFSCRISDLAQRVRIDVLIETFQGSDDIRSVSISCDRYEWASILRFVSG